MMYVRLLAILFVIKSKMETQAILFNSIDALETLIKTQAGVIGGIEDYLTEEREKFAFIGKFLQDSLKLQANRDPGYFWNPINAYSLMHRMARDFSFIRNITSSRTDYFKDNTLMYPSMEDVRGAAKGLTRIQTTYNLNITLLANGTLLSNFSRNNELYIEYASPMTSSDCYWMGLEPYTDQGYSGQLLWMREALIKFYIEKCSICPVTEESIVAHISQVYYNLREFKTALNWLKKLHAINPIRQNEDEKFMREIQEKVNTGMGLKTRREQKKAWRQPRYKYSECYKNLKPLSVHKLKLLHCSYERRGLFLMQSSLKQEALSIAPYVTMFHDIISDSEIEALTHLAKSKLSDTKVYDLENNTVKLKPLTNARLAKGAIMAQNISLVGKLMRRMGYMTGAKISQSIKIQVLNYGIGGMYMEHVDYLSTISHLIADLGDRIITCVFFLSDVEQGGALLFRILGLRIYPKKGAAVAWSVLTPSGDGDLAMVHTACPVIRGNRWVAVSWAYEKDQTTCPIWYLPHGIMTAEKYAKWSKERNESEKKVFSWLPPHAVRFKH